MTIPAISVYLHDLLQASSCTEIVIVPDNCPGPEHATTSHNEIDFEEQTSSSCDGLPETCRWHNSGSCSSLGSELPNNRRIESPRQPQRQSSWDWNEFELARKNNDLDDSMFSDSSSSFDPMAYCAAEDTVPQDELLHLNDCCESQPISGSNTVEQSCFPALPAPTSGLGMLATLKVPFSPNSIAESSLYGERHDRISPTMHRPAHAHLPNLNSKLADLDASYSKGRVRPSQSESLPLKIPSSRQANKELTDSSRFKSCAQRTFDADKQGYLSLSDDEEDVRPSNTGGSLHDFLANMTNNPERSCVSL